MILQLTEAIGPIAPLIVRDQIKVLDEPLNAFPKRRLAELIEKVCEDILDENVKESFKMSVEEFAQSRLRIFLQYYGRAPINALKLLPSRSTE